MKKTVLSLFASASLLATGAMAQTTPPAAGYPRMEFFQRIAPEPEGAINFLYTELANGAETLKGAPYTATALSETTQVLADGNRIVNKSSTLIARDGEGRVRREQTIGTVGPLQVDGGQSDLH